MSSSLPARSSAVSSVPPGRRRVRVQIGAPTVVLPDDVLVQPMELAAYLAGVSSDACTKGHFVNQLGAYVREVRPAAYGEFRRAHPTDFAAFRDVPFHSTLDWGVDAARLAHPGVPISEALRTMGRAAYGVMLRSLLGRVLFAALGRDMDTIFRNGPKAHELFETNGTRVQYVRLGEGHFRYEYDRCFNWIDSYQIGVVEGAALACGYTTEITVTLATPYRGSLECRWRAATTP